MRDAELLRERVTLLTQVQPYIGLYYSNAWVKRNVLHLSEEEVEQIQKEIDEENGKEKALLAGRVRKLAGQKARLEQALARRQGGASPPQTPS